MSTCPSCRTTLAPGALFCGACGAQLAPKHSDNDPFLQQVIGGRYQVIQKIGSGGMGDVYLAQHQQVAQQVAIKFLSRRLTGDPQIVQRFFNEARAIARLHHPGAVTLNDFGQTDDGTLYIIMEYIQGEPLSRLIARERRLSEEAAVHIALQLCEVLDAAHKQGIIHRDLKPDNIMLAPGRKGRHIVKVLDFGIAKLVSEENHLTQTGMVYGTPEFMSPEQAIGQPIDPRADLYAVACILYFMLTGAPPFSAQHPMAVMRAQASDEPAPPRRKNPDADVSPALEAILMRALQKRPDDRQPSVNALADELEALRPQHSGTIAALPLGDQRKISRALSPQGDDHLEGEGDPSFSPELSVPLRSTPEPVKADLASPEGPASFGGPLADPRAASFDMGLDPDEHAQLFDAAEEQPRSALRGSPRGLWLPGVALLALLLVGAAVYALTRDEDPAQPPEADAAQPEGDAALPEADTTAEADIAEADTAEADAADAGALAIEPQPDLPREEPAPAPEPPPKIEKRQKKVREKKKVERKKRDERKANPDPAPVPKNLGQAPAEKKDPPKDSPIPKTLP